MNTNGSGSGAVAIVGVGAILPDAPNAAAFWQNLRAGRYSITDVTDRWDADLYYDPDPRAPDKTYTKIGGWCRDFEWDPLGWKMPIPPKVGEVMDLAQKWAVAGAREALLDYGYPDRPLDQTRTAVIVGNALGGDKHLITAARIMFPEFGDELRRTPSFRALPADVQQAVYEEFRTGIRGRVPEITEDTMPGELGNIVAGRISALFDFKGPNYIADAACASAIAAMSAAIEGLRQHDYDAVVTGGIDANMSAAAYVKFCKIGALSATGTRPYAEGADGFVMGEGAAIFVLKRLEDAERDGDRIYAVLLGTGGSSDGKGKGITAPNPVGQKFAVERAWDRAGVAPQAGDLVEGHGTSTKVGDVVEVESLSDVFSRFGLPAGSVALGSVKSNIGHLKAAAGAAGVLKAALALHHEELPPSVNFQVPNPSIDFARSPFTVNTELRPWEKPGSNGETVRRAGVSAFGFGGTNFHLVMEEYVPGRHRTRTAVPGAELEAVPPQGAGHAGGSVPHKAPLRGALVIGGADEAAIAGRLRDVKAAADAGEAPEPTPPREADLAAPVRLAIDYGDAEELGSLAGLALRALEEGQDGRWRALRNKGVYLGRGAPGKVAFLFPGQGSQYVDMLKALRDADPVVAETFREADATMTPVFGGPLTGRIYADVDDEAARAKAEERLRQTETAQPAMLTVDTALARLLVAYGIEPDLLMGHSLGEYGALVAADAIDFPDALRAVALRGEAMRNVSVGDNGLMAAAFGSVEKVRGVLDGVDGYVVIANINSTKECVIGGATDAVEAAMERLKEEGVRVAPLPVSHAFHTEIVSSASEPLKAVLRTMTLRAPRTPVVANVDASLYPTGPDAPERIVEILGAQIGSPVQFVDGLEKLYASGARVFVEVGPKRALYGMAADVLGDREDVTILFTNHQRTDDLVGFNRALCGLYAAGVGRGREEAPKTVADRSDSAAARAAAVPPTHAPAPSSTPPSAAGTAPEPAAVSAPTPAAAAPTPTASAPPPAAGEDRYVTLGRMFADFLDRSFATYAGGASVRAEPLRIGITGASLGLPGEGRVFDEANVARILEGRSFITSMSDELKRGQLDKRITRLVKGPQGEARFETIDDPDLVIKLAGRGGSLDLVDEFGFPEDRIEALDRVTRLAIAAGIDALRDAGIPMVMRYKSTTTGSKLPVGWGLPEEMRDDTGVVFGSAFPGYDSLVRTLDAYHEDRAKRARIEELERVRDALDGDAREEVEARIADLSRGIDQEGYQFDRRFLFQVLSMGHSQFAEFIGARGPNTALNGACATGMQALATARDWIEAGRCRRVVVITADDITTDAMFPWWSSGFLASGAAATDERVEDAALPFDRRRHGLIVGMGGAGLVVEDVGVAAERGVWPICDVLGTVVANSAYHGSRLDIDHIVHVMESLVSQVENRWGVSREEMAQQTVFVSHETYTPARGGSAGAEVEALRKVFGSHVDRIVVANTKGFTGHPMGVGVEESLAVKILETGVIPPVANFREVDPELGTLNLSRGGSYPVTYALRLGAGFGSQIAMSLLRWTPPPDGARRRPDDLGFHHRVADPEAWSAWLARVTGYPAPELEVVQRTLRVKDQGPPAVAPASRPRTACGVGPAAPADPVRAAAHAPPAPLQAQTTTVPVHAATPAAPAQPMASRPAAPAVRSAPAAAVPAGPVTGDSMAADSVAADPMADDPVAAKVLAIVSEQTGYPPDMLALDLDLEADLGIDTVKQAEMFAAIRTEYDIERDDNLALRDYPTLARAIDFVYEKRPELARAAPGPQAPSEAAVAPVPVDPVHAAAPADAEPPQTGPGSNDPIAVKVLEIVAEQTGYPPDMLALDLDLEADLGIDTVKQAEMFAAIRGEWDIERDDDLALRDYPTLADAIAFVYEKRPDLSPADGGDPAAAPDAAAAEPAAAPADADLMQTGPRPNDPVAVKVLEIVAEQTGYPPDMLDFDLDLEADLGIDTVKQAEMFAAIRGEWDIERDDDLALRDYPTLADAIAFVYEKRPDLSPDGGGDSVAPEAVAVSGDVAERAAAEGEDTPGAATVKTPAGSMDEAQRVPRRVPVPRLRPQLDRFPRTGVELDGARVVVVPDEGGIGGALAGLLGEAGADVLVADPAQPTEALVAEIQTWAEGGAPAGVYWLPALDRVPADALATPEDRAEAVRRRVKSLHAVMRSLYDRLGEAGTFLVSGTRLGGFHGYDEAGATDALGGAVTGYTKAFARERPDALVKAVDFAPSRKTKAIARVLIDETLRDAGAVEIGIAGERRWSIGLEEQPVEASGSLVGDGVYVVTGAAGSIVSAIIGDLAAADGGTYWLLDLAPEPDPANPDLERLRSDPEGLRRDTFERLKAEGERVTPVQVEKAMAALERQGAALDAIRSIEEAGGSAHYRSLDLRDADAVAAVMNEVAGSHGKVDVLLHAAGLEISRPVDKKSEEEFALVFDVKTEGWFNLMAGLGDTPLGAAVVFSSIAGRFGNAGQVDYSAANDLLCKAVSGFRRTRPDTRGIALDWTAWRDIGMASRGSIPAIMEAAGIDMLPPDAGIPIVRRELVAGDRGEVVVADGLGVMLEQRASVALDTAFLEDVAGGAGPMVGAVTGFTVYDGLVVETELSPAEQPFLQDHRIDGTAVLPGVMGIEAMAEAATLLFPDRHVTTIEDVSFHAPFKFYRDEPRTVTVKVGFALDGDDVVADCRLLGSRLLLGRDEADVTTHFTGRVRLSPSPPADEASTSVPDVADDVVDAAEIYRTYFHGPAYRVLGHAWRADGLVAGRFADAMPPNHSPPERPTVAAPRLVELAFQTAGLAEIAGSDRMGLPHGFDKLELHQPGVGEEGAAAMARDSGQDAFDVDVAGPDGRLIVALRGYRTSALPQPVDASPFGALKG